MVPAELHSFFIYVFFGYLLIFPAVLIFLRLFAIRNPEQRLQAYLFAFFTPLAGFLLYHTVLLKRCQTGRIPTGLFGRLFDALCQAGFLAVSYISPFLAGLLVIGLLKAVAGAFFTMRLSRQDTSPASNVRELISYFLVKHSASMGLACPDVIFTSRDSFIALTAGLHRPRVYLSAPLLAEFTPAELEHILLHELAHIRRGDCLKNWLLSLVRDLVFFNPFSNFLFWRYQQETERLCDREAVRRVGGNALVYATTLLKAWRILMQRRSTVDVLTCSLSGPQNSLEARINSLLNTKAIGDGRLPVPLFLASLATLFVVTVLYLGYIC